ncbi:ribosomal RNA-processing protein 7 homolog A-like isoform X2 [Babylonia areolata]
MYLKKLERRQAELQGMKPPDRTVFVDNTPAWATESDFKHAFGCCGKVEKVILQHAPSRGKDEKEEEDYTHTTAACKKIHRVAYIIFSCQEAADKAVELPYHCPLILKSGDSLEHGLARYKEQYLTSRAFDIDDIKNMINEKIAEHDRKEKEKEEQAKKNEPDEDGWITVTRVGKNKGAPRTETEEARVKTKESKKRKRKELVNFYSFQNREMKRKRIEDLQKQFQEDKSAIEKMKQERKFRPF